MACNKKYNSNNQYKPNIWVPGYNLDHLLFDGLVGAWIFNEGSGSRVNDLSGRGNGGIATGDFFWFYGSKGSFLESSNVRTDYVDLGNIGVLDNATESTLLIKFYVNDWVHNSFLFAIGKWASGQINLPFGLVIKNITGVQTLFAYVADNNNDYVLNKASTDGPQLQENVWYDYALTFRAKDKLQGYLDGKEQLAVGFPKVCPNVNEIRAGEKYTIFNDEVHDKGLDGSIEYAFLYDRVLSINEINKIRNDPYEAFHSKTLVPVVKREEEPEIISTTAFIRNYNSNNQYKPSLWSPGINFGHPLANGLVSAYLMNEGGNELIDLVHSNNATKVGV